MVHCECNSGLEHPGERSPTLNATLMSDDGKSRLAVRASRPLGFNVKDLRLSSTDINNGFSHCGGMMWARELDLEASKSVCKPQSMCLTTDHGERETARTVARTVNLTFNCKPS